jgi:Flp pilus assembly protein TadD
MAHELERAATSLVSSGQFAAAEAVFTEALTFAPHAANLLGALAWLHVVCVAGAVRAVRYGMR